MAVANPLNAYDFEAPARPARQKSVLCATCSATSSSWQWPCGYPTIADINGSRVVRS